MLVADTPAPLPVPDLRTLWTIVAPWLYLALAVVSAGLTLNAFVPVRRSRLLVVPSFLLGTLAVELAAYGVLAQGVLVALFSITAGVLGSSAGKVAVGLSVATVAGLATLVIQGMGAAKTVRATLTPMLGRPPRPVGAWWRLLVPFPLRVATDRVTRNVVYARVAGQTLRLDVYHPRGDGRARPAVVHLHGGGWVLGDKREQGVPLMAVLADRGFVGFNVNYRLSPGATWPDHLVDVKRAIAWVRAHADEYGVDPSFIAICGGSAGGHLATMAGLTAGDTSLQPGFESADTSVSAVASLYAIYDMTDAAGRQVPGFHASLLEPWVLKAFVDEHPERFASASPLQRIVAGAPPFFVLHGDRDNLAPLADARDFVAAMRKTSTATVLFAEIGGAQHSFDLFLSPRSLPILEGIAEFFEVHHARAAGTAPS